MITFFNDICLNMERCGGEMRFDFVEKDYGHIDGFYLFGISDGGLRLIDGIHRGLLSIDLDFGGRLKVTGVDLDGCS